jgi:hypothetical protein
MPGNPEPLLALLIPVDITSLQVRPLDFSCSPSSPPVGGNGNDVLDFVTCIIITLAAGWHFEMQCIIQRFVACLDILVSGSDLKIPKCHLGCQIV